MRRRARARRRGRRGDRRDVAARGEARGGAEYRRQPLDGRRAPLRRLGRRGASHGARAGFARRSRATRRSSPCSGPYDDAPASRGTVSEFRNLLHHHVHHESPGEATTFWTGLGAVRRDAFERVGGFDPSLDWLEDIDLGMRLAGDGRPDRARSRDPGHAPQALEPRGHGEDRLRRPRPTVDGAHARETAARRSVLNLGWRHRASALAAIGGAAGVVTRRPLVVAASRRSARRPQPSVLPAPRATHGGAARSRRGSGCTRSTISWAWRPSRSRSRSTSRVRRE